MYFFKPYLFSVIICGLILTGCATSQKISTDPVKNTITKVQAGKIKTIAMEMNAPGWADAALDVSETAAVGVIDYFFGGVASVAAGIFKGGKDNSREDKRIAETTASHLLINKTLESFYNAVARPFNTLAVDKVQEGTSFVLAAFNLQGKVGLVLPFETKKEMLAGLQLLHESSPEAESYLSAETPYFVAVKVSKSNMQCLSDIASNAFLDKKSLELINVGKVDKNSCALLIAENML